MRALFVVGLVAIVLAACSPCTAKSQCTFECATSRDCPPGQECMHEQAHDLSLDVCRPPCSYTDAGLPAVSCPDSPAQTACTGDDGGVYCPLK